MRWRSVCACICVMVYSSWMDGVKEHVCVYARGVYAHTRYIKYIFSSRMYGAEDPCHGIFVDVTVYSLLHVCTCIHGRVCVHMQYSSSTMFFVDGWGGGACTRVPVAWYSGMVRSSRMSRSARSCMRAHAYMDACTCIQRPTCAWWRSVCALLHHIYKYIHNKYSRTARLPLMVRLGE
jgi:hypothetical protein